MSKLPNSVSDPRPTSELSQMRNPYSLNVLIGNWEEDLRVMESKMRDFLVKKKRSQLKVSRTRQTFANLLKEIPFIQKGQYIRFGQIVQVLCPNLKTNTGETGVVLCGSVTEADIDFHQHFSDNSTITATPVKAPNVKSLFKILRPRNQEQDESHLNYGDVFVLASSRPEPPWHRLYVQSDPPRATRPGNGLNHGICKFTSKENIYCCWKILFLDKSQREKMTGHPIPPKTPFIMKHAMTNKCLSAEPTLWLNTFFGVECEVAVHDYYDQHKKECDQSIWSFTVC